MATTRTEKKIEKALDHAEREHDKAAVKEAKGHITSAERHEAKAVALENRAATMAHGMPAGGANPYTGLGMPLTGAATHPSFGYQRLPRDKKAERFEAKAMEWERRGNAAKAQKNRDKALRHRQRLQPGYTPIAHPQPYYVDKANRFDQRAIRYHSLGMLPQAQRYQQRALRTRSKHGVPAGAGLGGMTGATVLTGQQHVLPTAGVPLTGASHPSTIAGLTSQPGHTTTAGGFVGPIVPVGGLVYRGIEHPYNTYGATQHPKFGYSKLTSAQKAQRFDAKAAEWERRGDVAKAQKNREKANRYRAMGQAGYVKPTRSQDYYISRAASLDNKAIRYQQMGKHDRALRSQQRAQRIRAKHNIPLGGAGAGMVGLGAGRSFGSYQGLNFPYTNAAAHPTYGYNRLPHNQKAERFEAKAAEWQRRGNMAKAQKNREKAQRYRARSQPGYVKPVRTQDYYQQRAALFDQKAARYQQWGMQPQYQRYQGRSQRLRAKHNLPAHTSGQTLVGPIVPVGTTYSGLSFPYTGASAHPTYGYQRLPHNKKAERFEAKAAEWERRGNLAKAQKNREKAQRYRARSQPGYVAPVRPQTYYVDRANLFDQKAAQYNQWGMAPQATRYQQRAHRIRTKRNIQPTSAYSTSSVPVTRVI